MLLWHNFFLVDKIQDAAVSVLNKAVGDHFISSHRVVFSLQPTKTAFNFLRVSCSKGWQLINAKKRKKRQEKREARSSMEMSDRAANCVLGDKDASKREK